MPEIQQQSAPQIVQPPPPTDQINEIGKNAATGPVSVADIVNALRAEDSARASAGGKSGFAGHSDEEIISGFFNGGYRNYPGWSSAMQNPDDLTITNDLGRAPFKPQGPATPKPTQQTDPTSIGPTKTYTSPPPPSPRDSYKPHTEASPSSIWDASPLRAVQDLLSPPVSYSDPPPTPTTGMPALAHQLIGTEGQEAPYSLPVRVARGLGGAAGQGIEEATTQGNLITMGVMAALGPMADIAPSLQKAIPYIEGALGSVFRGTMAADVVTKIPGVADAIAKNDVETATRLIATGIAEGTIAAGEGSVRKAWDLVKRFARGGRVVSTAPPGSPPPPPGSPPPPPGSPPPPPGSPVEVTPAAVTPAKKQAAVASIKAKAPVIQLPQDAQGKQTYTANGVNENKPIKLVFGHPADEAVYTAFYGDKEDAARATEYLKNNYSGASLADRKIKASQLKSWVNRTASDNPALIQNGQLEVPTVRSGPTSEGSKARGKQYDSIADWGKLATEPPAPTPTPAPTPVEVAAKKTGEIVGNSIATPEPSTKPEAKSKAKKPVSTPTPTDPAASTATTTEPVVAPYIATVKAEAPSGGPVAGQRFWDPKERKFYNYTSYTETKSGTPIHTLTDDSGTEIKAIGAGFKNRFPGEPAAIAVPSVVKVQTLGKGTGVNASPGDRIHSPLTDNTVTVVGKTKNGWFTVKDGPTQRVISKGDMKDFELVAETSTPLPAGEPEASKANEIPDSKKKDLATEPPTAPPEDVELGPKEKWVYGKQHQYAATPDNPTGIIHSLKDPSSGKWTQVPDNEFKRDFPEQSEQLRQSAVQAAKERLSAAQKRGERGSISNRPLDDEGYTISQKFRDIYTVGHDTMLRVGKNLDKWTSEMVGMYGDHVRPYLDAVWSHMNPAQPLKDPSSGKWAQVPDPEFKRDFPEQAEQLRQMGTRNDSGSSDMPQMARTESGKVKLGADIASLGNILGSSLYNRESPTVVTKELLQNAYDAVRGVRDGRVDVHVDHHEHSISVSDNGKGMTADDLATVFTDLGSSGKRGQADASGGFGLAKAAPLMMSDKIEVRTVSVDPSTGKKMEHILNTNKEDLLGEGSEVVSRVVPDDTKTGTSIKSYLKKDTDLYNVPRFIRNADRSINPPGKLFGTQSYGPKVRGGFDRPSKIEGDNYGEEKVEQPKFMASTEIKGSNGDKIADVDIHSSPKPGGLDSMLPDGVVPVEVNNNGIYQFNHSIYLSDGQKVAGLPKRIAIDVKSSVPEGHKDYPFSANRESLRDSIMEGVNKVIEDKYIKPAKEAFMSFLSKKYDSMPTFKTGLFSDKIPLYDSGNRMTPEETDKILNNKDLTGVASTINDVMRKTIKVASNSSGLQSWSNGRLAGLGGNIERVGIVMAPEVHGVHVKKPGGSKATAFINPLSFSEDSSPYQIASLVWHTIKHELLHDKIAGHYEAFTSSEAMLSHAIGEYELEALQGIKNAYVDPTTNKLRTGINDALRIYKESRGRGSVERDIFGGEASSARGHESGPSNEKQDNAGLRNGRKVSLPVTPEPPRSK